jgi:anti-anti-sigma factor
VSRPRFDLGRRHEDVLVVSVHGDLDLGSADDLRSALDSLNGADVLRVDLAGVRMLDSTALGVLLAAAQRLSARGGRLELTGSSASVRRVLHIAGLDVVFTV